MSVMRKNPGDTVSYYFYFKDKDGALFDPTSNECKVVNPAGSETAVTLNKVSVGKYSFDYTLPSDAAEGLWKIKVKGTKNSYVQTELFYFVVEAL